MHGISDGGRKYSSGSVRDGLVHNSRDRNEAGNDEHGADEQGVQGNGVPREKRIVDKHPPYEESVCNHYHQARILEQYRDRTQDQQQQKLPDRDHQEGALAESMQQVW